MIGRFFYGGFSSYLAYDTAMQIKRIVPKSLGRIMGLLYGIVGAVTGLFISIATLMAGSTDGGGLNHVFGVAAIILVPVLYAIGGFIGGYVTAWVYNLVAKRVGGIEIETQ
jgi:hypothetical protein